MNYVYKVKSSEQMGFVDIESSFSNLQFVAEEYAERLYRTGSLPADGQALLVQVCDSSANLLANVIVSIEYEPKFVGRVMV